MASNIEYLDTTKANIAGMLQSVVEGNEKNEIKSIIILVFNKDKSVTPLVDITQLKGAELYIPIGVMSQISGDLAMCIDPSDTGE